MSATSARRRRRRDSMEQACLLCRRAEADPDICGPKQDHQGICVHRFCLLFASDLQPQGTEEEEQMAFLSVDILYVIQLAAEMVCFVCGEMGATVACNEVGCGRRFHLPCAVEGGCVTRYFLPYSSFCWEHRPQQQELAAPEDTNCLICMDPVEGRTTYGTMVCSACKHAWFHRACIQGQAMRAAAFCFQCPLCQNTKLFLTEMLCMGIRIPVRQASWEDNNPYADLYQRHGSCDARECLCPGGREENKSKGPWQLILCHSCAAVGTHRRCSNLGNRREDTRRWECDSCAGLVTYPSASSELAGAGTASPAASGQSPGSLELEFSSPSPSSQAASGQTVGHAAQETSSPSTASPAASQHTLEPQAQESSSPSTASPAASAHTLEPQAQESSSPSSSGQMPSAPCHSCPVCEGSSLSSQPGPDRRRRQTRCTRQTQTPYTWPRRLQERGRPPATRTASSTRRQAVPRRSQCSASRGTRRRSTNRQQPSAASRGSAPLQRSLSNRPGGPMRVRDRSRLQRRAQAPYARPRRRSQGSRTAAARAGRSPRRQAPPRLSQGSPARASRSRSRRTTTQRPSASSRGAGARQRASASRSAGPVPVRDRSRSQRRAQTPRTRRRRRR